MRRVLSSVGLLTLLLFVALVAQKTLAQGRDHSALQRIAFDAQDSGPVTEGSLSVGKFYRYSRQPHPDYADHGASKWSDGVIVTDDPRDAGAEVAWLGSERIDVVIDLGRRQTLQKLEIEGYLKRGQTAPQGIVIRTRKQTDDAWELWQEVVEARVREDELWHLSLFGDNRSCRYVMLTLTPGAATADALTSLAHIDLQGLIQNTWKNVPSEGALHGAFPTAAGFDEATLQGRGGMVIDLYEALVGKQLAMVLWYQKMTEGRPFAEIQRLREEKLGQDYQGYRFLSLGWEPLNLEEIVAGELDAYLEKYFRAAIDPEITGEIDDPIWFRPMGEFNGGWVAWGLDRKNFLRAWRRLYNIAEQVGALDKHILVWAPNHLSYPNTPENQAEVYWPGDQYVDWVGVSCYPMSEKFAQTPDSFYPVQNIAAIYDKYADYKPFMIVEGGFNDAVDRERYVREWLQGLPSKRPKVKVVVWENHKQRIISRSPEALELYRKLVQDPYWISLLWRETSAE